MIEIEIIQDGIKKKVTMQEFFADHWNLFRDKVLEVIQDDLLNHGKIRQIIKRHG